MLAPLRPPPLVSVRYDSGSPRPRQPGRGLAGDAAAQTRQILGLIERALAEAGATLADVVRDRVCVTDIGDLPAVVAELGRVFAAVRPAGTLVAVTTLVEPSLVVEIEVDAVVGSR